jgi:predicted site-specific integrase-resolvase
MLLCPADVAAELGVSRSLVAQWIRTGRVHVRRDRRGWAWIERWEVERLRDERRRRKRKHVRPDFGEAG